MGKGDKKTRKGKIFMQSYGKSRLKRKLKSKNSNSKTHLISSKNDNLSHYSNVQNKKMHPLKCNICGSYNFLIIKLVVFEKDDKKVYYNLPFYECKNCSSSTPLFTLKQCEKMAEEDRQKLKKGESIHLLFDYEEKKFERFDHLGFKYDSTDYHLIPGLIRPYDEGYLTPVFFDKDILLYYNNHPDYSVKLTSFSSGNIYYKGEAMFSWGFGINRNGLIFKWLGDLNDDFEEKSMLPHLKRFQASNIDSDHDIVSKFYLSQIPFSPSDAFQDSDNESKLFALKNALEKKIFDTYKFNLSKLDIDNLSEYYRYPILEERHQIFSAYLSLNKLLIENIEQEELKKIILDNGLSKDDIKGFRSLKLLGLFFEKILNFDDGDKLLAPFYVLYDLRQLHGHLIEGSFEEKYNYCKSRLSLGINSSDFEVYKKLIESLIDSLNIIATRL